MQAYRRERSAHGGLEEGETWNNGTHAWVSTAKMPLYNEMDQVVGLFGLSRDITEHRDTEIRAGKPAEEKSRFREKMEDDVCLVGVCLLEPPAA